MIPVCTQDTLCVTNLHGEGFHGPNCALTKHAKASHKDYTMDNMYWRPTVKIPDGVKLSYSLKEVFRRKFRRIQRNDSFKIVLNRTHSNDVTYLQALVDAHVEGAQELLEALKKHESIDIWLDI